MFQPVRGLALLLGALLALLTTAGHAAPADDLPVLGDASSGIVSPEVEAMLGDDFLRQLRAQLPTRGDPLLHYWTEALLYRLAAASDLREAQLKLVLIDAAPINAFAAPGGIVGINFGTYAQAATVHEFSSILAHELAHLSQRHFARGVEAQRQASLPFMAAMLASAALMATVGGDAGLAALASAQAVSQQNQLRYSRSREREADRLGLETMVRAGMDPWAASRMFEHMADVSRFSRRLPEFLLTHPVTESRIADARAQASAYPRKSYPLSLPFQLMRARVRMLLAEARSRGNALPRRA